MTRTATRFILTRNLTNLLATGAIEELLLLPANLIAIMDNTSGKDRTRKSEEIATTPACKLRGKGAVTPRDQPTNEREQQSSKKKTRRDETNNGSLFWGGRKGSAAVQRRDPSPINTSPTHCKDTRTRKRNRQHSQSPAHF